MEKVKVTFMLPSGTKTFLKVYAAKTDKSISEVIETAIKEYLERNPVK